MPAFDPFFARLCAATPVQSQTELARQLGVNRSAVTQAKQRGTVPESWVYKLARIFSLDPNWLIGENEARTSGPSSPSEEFWPIPKVKARRCIQTGSFEPEQETHPTLALSTQWLWSKGHPEHMVLMDMSGENMEPLIQEGDRVLVDQSQQEIVAGRIYAVGIEDIILVKRVEKHPGKLVLISANPRYAPLVLSGEELHTVAVMGTVLWICRELY